VWLFGHTGRQRRRAGRGFFASLVSLPEQEFVIFSLAAKFQGGIPDT
jgi:hypothetical protein